MEEVARVLRVATKTVRRWINAGRLVSRRIGPNTVRVDASSVTRLLAASPSEDADGIFMGTKKEGSPGGPRLLRQRGRSKVWTAVINSEEVPLGTTDEAEARRRLREATSTTSAAPPSTQPSRVRRPWRVYQEGGRFVVKYYDAEGKRRTHRLDEEAGVLVTTETEAEKYAEVWYRKNVEHSGPAPVPVTRVVAGDAERITFEQFGRLWTTGELAKRYPDHVKLKRTANADEGRLRMYVYPIIGSHPMSDFEGPAGLTLTEKVLESLPPVGPTFSRGSRRQVMQAINRLFVLAVYPAKLLSGNPLPKGFLPKADTNKAKSYVYPDEDAKLLACRGIPLVKRLFYGLLAREGFRVSELLLLEWSDLDLDRGAVNLDHNKTDEPRTWALDPGDVEALRRWKKHFAGSRAPSKPVLVDRFGNTVNRFSAAEDLREYLKKAGVHRPQLFEASGTRIRLRAHDLRATFVTVHLAAGKTEAWITDRTGHKSSQMIYRYKRQARTHAELSLGTLKPLYEGIPELAEVTST
ncbi:tyrosine-type recombinase/integrase [Polyangium mundeleinium]|uniref:Tyrosine-type recombinase/integrase n=1 Tax=Polyangium mundeleinium TaxID=2995306 RepID=A0ABT5F8X4_9BACT|nr:tyrosine-type recombinase/integrase [Polyangium mundeleinium]MDC0749947.1 tyrosine-type recombinase/integrase [Polyangium mundeleinium]